MIKEILESGEEVKLETIPQKRKGKLTKRPKITPEERKRREELIESELEKEKQNVTEQIANDAMIFNDIIVNEGLKGEEDKKLVQRLLNVEELETNEPIKQKRKGRMTKQKKIK